eukprot:SAG11_NODE_2756_length_3006_cov_8.607155_4_plen_25_part_01
MTSPLFKTFVLKELHLKTYSFQVLG